MADEQARLQAQVDDLAFTFDAPADAGQVAEAGQRAAKKASSMLQGVIRLEDTLDLGDPVPALVFAVKDPVARSVNGSFMVRVAAAPAGTRVSGEVMTAPTQGSSVPRYFRTRMKKFREALASELGAG